MSRVIRNSPLIRIAYFWVGHTNGVQIQILATLIFYTILNQLVGQVAIALRQPKEKISVEMVFRSLYYVAKVVLRGENPDAVLYLTERAKLFGLIKAERKRHRQKRLRDGESHSPCPTKQEKTFSLDKFGILFP